MTSTPRSAPLGVLPPAAGWRTPQGRAVEAGTKGFWYQYANIFKVGGTEGGRGATGGGADEAFGRVVQAFLASLAPAPEHPLMGHPTTLQMVRELGVAWPFTPFSTSGFWGRGGELITQAPVFSDLPRFPAIIGQFVHTFDKFP